MESFWRTHWWIDYVWGADGDEHLSELERCTSKHLSSEALSKCWLAHFGLGWQVRSLSFENCVWVHSPPPSSQSALHYEMRRKELWLCKDGALPSLLWHWIRQARDSLCFITFITLCVNRSSFGAKTAAWAQVCVPYSNTLSNWFLLRRFSV